MNFLQANLDYFVFGILGVMSFILISLVIERYIYFKRLDITSFDHVELLTVSVTKHLTSISTIGVNAPYVGLLGTVLGILITFNEIGQSGNVEVNSIMVGLAMALKATAAGLVVAIPAMILYNGLSRRAETLIAQWKAFQDAKSA